MAMYAQYQYDGSSTNVYLTTGYGGPDPEVEGTQRFTGGIDVTQKVYGACEMRFHSSGATDDLEVSLYGRLDDAWDGDEIAIFSITIDSDGLEHFWSLSLGDGFGPGHYHFGLKASGSTDTFQIDFNVRRARYEIAES